MTAGARGCVASPHHIASDAGLAVLRAGGNAMDAAIAVNLVLGVVTPYLCGYGGDLFAMVWDGSRLHGYNGSGRAPALATPEAARAAIGSDVMPRIGPHTVTVPGAVQGWFDLLDRFGSMSFERLAEPAIALALDGFVPSERGAASLAGPGYDEPEWRRIYAGARAGVPFAQPDLARTIELLASEGPDAYYRGPVAAAMAQHLSERGALMRADDLAAHHGDWVEPLVAPFDDYLVAQMPPNTQGVTALQALRIADLLPDEDHARIEAAKMAMADRERFVSDARAMPVGAEELVSDEHVQRWASRFDPARAIDPGRVRPARGGTAYMCAADDRGMLVSLIQSNFAGFGSGVTVPGWGINLHNRGTYFRLDPAHVNAIGPAKRTMHTLIPAMALEQDGRPWLVFGTMGGDGQPQTHLQLLTRMRFRGARSSPQEAIDAPRWFVSPQDRSVAIEPAAGEQVVDALRARGHLVRVTGPLDSLMGHAHAIEVTPQGYRVGSDPRCEGSAACL